MRKPFQAIIVFIIVVLSLINGRYVQAIEKNLVKTNPDINVLVIYSTEIEDLNADVRLLDLSLGHFSNNVEHVNVHHVELSDLEDKTHLIYYGHIKERFSSKVAEVVSAFDGPTMAIGYNTEQLGEKYSFLTVGREQTITKLDYLEDKEKAREIEPDLVFETETTEEIEVLIQGSGEEGQFPLVMRNGNTYYYASNAVDQPYSVYLSQVLNIFFDAQTTETRPAYIRLEDVHPLSDAGRLRAVAEELTKRKIPYMIAVIPVYTDPESGRRYHFHDNREILKVLKYMQDNGGSIVLHRYTHQFRDSETGEGFEFWDVENEMPIYHGPDDEVEKFSWNDFESYEEYEAYISEKQVFERKYIEERLTRGVQELANYGLYPLAFEAPHYTLSQYGYQVVSDMFSTYVGQVQLSDEKWELMDTTPYASRPSILNGMLLLPETIGFVEPDVEKPVEVMMSRADYYLVSEGAMIGAFYHPYLGLDGLKELLDEMEQIENIEWIDLKQLNNTVVVDNVTIQSGNGEIQAEVSYWGLMTSSFDFTYYHLRELVIKVTWAIAVIGITAVLMFFSFIFYLKIRQRREEKQDLKDSQVTIK